MKQQSFLSIIIVLCYLGVSIEAQEISPSFHTNYVRLLGAVNSSLHDVYLGVQYIVVSSDVYELVNPSETQPAGYPEYRTSFVEVWTTSSLQASEDIFVEPVAQLELSLSDTSLPIEFALSSDEQFLAINRESDTLILAMPSLEQHQLLPYTGELAWSLENNRLAIVSRGQIAVWDANTNNTYEYHFDYPHQYLIHALHQGWLLDDRRNEDGIAFSFCTNFLDNCQAYEGDNQFNVVPTNNGQQVLVPIGDVNTTGQVEVWEFQDGQEMYRQTIALADTNPPICPSSFSPENHYLFSFCDNVIWDYDALEIIQELRQGQSPAWLTEAYFLTMDLPDTVMNIYLYQIGNQVPLAQIELSEALKPLWDSVLENNEASLSLALRGRIHISNEHDFAIVDLDWAVVFIPIQWQ